MDLNKFYAVSDPDVLEHTKALTEAQLTELRSVFRGKVYRRKDPQFIERATCFNGALNTPACLLVIPLDTNDISEAVVFCNRHNLTPSVKSGGYGTHGLSIEGDMIIDMHRFVNISLSVENIPMKGSRAAMDSDQDDPIGPLDFSTGNRQPFPKSTISPYVAPDLLKRTRDEAFGDDSDNEDEGRARNPSGVAMSPSHTLVGSGSSARPSISSTVMTTSNSGDSIPTSVDMERTSSKSGSSGKKGKKPTFRPLTDVKSTASTSRRTRPRLTSPETAPAEDTAAQYLEVPSRPEEESPSGSTGLTPDSGSRSASGSGSTPATSAHDHSSSAVQSPAPSTKTGVQITSTPSQSQSPKTSHSEESRSPRSTSLAEVASTPAPARGPFDYGSAPIIIDEVPSAANTGAAAVGSATSSAITYTATGSGGSSGSGYSPYPMPIHPIEPRHAFAYCTFGCGATEREIDQYNTGQPLPAISASGQPVTVPYYIPGAAFPVGSTFMLLGGFGFQTRLRGLSVDCLVEAEMVLADGRVVIVNEEEYPDLYWAIRGAGTAFGIVTRYKVKAFPIPIVYAGNIVYKFHPATAPSLIKHFRDCVKNAPNELYANVILTAGPRGSDALVVIQICWMGTKDGGLPFVQAIMSWSGDQCLLNEVNEKSFAHQQDSVAKVLKASAGRKWFLRSDVITSLTDELVHRTVEKFAGTPEGCAWLFELAGGAVAGFEDNCIPKAIRKGAFNIVTFHQWKIDDADTRCIDSAEEWMRDSVHPLSAGGPLPTFLERRELVTRTIGAFGEQNWDRLVDLKRTYDPQGMFRHNFWPLDNSGLPLGISEAPDGKGKAKQDGIFGNHFMDRYLAP